MILQTRVGNIANIKYKIFQIMYCSLNEVQYLLEKTEFFICD